MFSTDDTKDRIVELITQHDGLSLKNILSFMPVQLQIELVPSHLMSKYDIPALLNELVVDKQIVEILYFPKTDPDKKNSFYIPNTHTAIVVEP